MNSDFDSSPKLTDVKIYIFQMFIFQARESQRTTKSEVGPQIRLEKLRWGKRIPLHFKRIIDKHLRKVVSRPVNGNPDPTHKSAH